MYESGALSPHRVLKVVAMTLSTVELPVPIRQISMVGTGMSGALAIPLLAKEYGCPWAIVRKESDQRHSCSRIEGTIGQWWMFVDDLTSTGDTRERVRKEVDYQFTAARERGERLGYDCWDRTEFVGSLYYAHGGRFDPA